MTMANGNGRNGAKRAYEEQLAKRSPKRKYEEELAKQQAAMQRRRPSATQVEKARAAEMLLPEERFDRASRSRRRTDTARAGRAIEQQRAQPRGRRIRL